MKMPDQPQHCLNCMYFMEAEDTAGYFCRRYPPQIMFEQFEDGSGQFVSAWPSIDPNEWCGEHASFC